MVIIMLPGSEVEEALQPEADGCTSTVAHMSDLKDNSESQLPISKLFFPLGTSQLRQLLEEFYILYNSERVASIPDILEKYESNQLELFKGLKDRYGVAIYKPFDDLIAVAEASREPSQTADTSLPSNWELGTGGKGPVRSMPSNTSSIPANVGITGISAALSLNMQEIAGVSSNLIAGTGRLLTGVSTWTMPSGSASTKLSSYISSTSLSSSENASTKGISAESDRATVSTTKTPALVSSVDNTESKSEITNITEDTQEELKRLIDLVVKPRLN